MRHEDNRGGGDVDRSTNAGWATARPDGGLARIDFLRAVLQVVAPFIGTPHYWDD